MVRKAASAFNASIDSGLSRSILLFFSVRIASLMLSISEALGITEPAGCFTTEISALMSSSSAATSATSSTTGLKGVASGLKGVASGLKGVASGLKGATAELKGASVRPAIRFTSSNAAFMPSKAISLESILSCVKPATPCNDRRSVYFLRRSCTVPVHFAAKLENHLVSLFLFL